MDDREYILNRIKSRMVTPDEFNFDMLSAPPILSMFTFDDINKLRWVATTPTLAAKLKEKYKYIDEIMNNRGFVKFVSGTNRISYKCLENDSIIVKVAYNKPGMGDSPRELYNQQLLKPFVAKCYESTPCGVLGVFERVQPITNREEFLSIASDVYVLLSEYIIGEYVMDDIGTKYFMNYGVRKGFGPVILDYPFLYVLDSKRIFCNKPNNKEISNCCGGIITYDSGFNKLYCTKCGAIYKPFELAKKIADKEIILNNGGKHNMKITITGGSLENKEIVVGDFLNPATSIRSNRQNKKIDDMIKAEEKKNNSSKPKKEENNSKKSVNGAVSSKDTENKVTDNTVKEAAVDEIESPKKVKSPITFVDRDNDSDDESDVDKIFKNIISIAESYDNITEDEDKKKIAEYLMRMLSKLFNDNPDNIISNALFKLYKYSNINYGNEASFKYYRGYTTNEKDLDNSLNLNNVICVVDDEDNYVTDEDGNIILINKVDDKDYNELTLVPIDWDDNINELIYNTKDNDSEDEEEEESEEEDISDETLIDESDEETEDEESVEE